MVAIVIGLSLKRWLFCIKQVERREVILHQGAQALGYCSVSNLDDRGPMSRLCVTTLQLPPF